MPCYLQMRGKPMVQILTRLCKFADLHVMVLDGFMLLEAPSESWPKCDVLIGFDAKGSVFSACASFFLTS